MTSHIRSHMEYLKLNCSILTLLLHSNLTHDRYNATYWLLRIGAYFGGPSCRPASGHMFWQSFVESRPIAPNWNYTSRHREESFHFPDDEFSFKLCFVWPNLLTQIRPILSHGLQGVPKSKPPPIKKKSH